MHIGIVQKLETGMNVTKLRTNDFIFSFGIENGLEVA